MSCLYNAVFVHDISFWVIDRVIHKCNAGCDSCFNIFITSRFRKCPKRNIVLARQLCVFRRGILVEKIASVMSIGPTNLLTCSTDGPTSTLQDIRNAPASYRLGVSRGFLLGLTEF